MRCRLLLAHPHQFHSHGEPPKIPILAYRGLRNLEYGKGRWRVWECGGLSFLFMLSASFKLFPRAPLESSESYCNCQAGHRSSPPGSDDRQPLGDGWIAASVLKSNIQKAKHLARHPCASETVFYVGGQVQVPVRVNFLILVPSPVITCPHWKTKH